MKIKMLFMNMIKNMKLKKKLYISYVLISMIPIMVLGIYSYYQAKKIVLNQSVYNLQNNIDKVSENIQTKINFYDNIINSIVFNTKIQQMFSNNYNDMEYLMKDLRDYLTPFFEDILNMHDDINQITIYSNSKMPEYGKFIQTYSKIEQEDWVNKVLKSYKPKWIYQDNTLFSAKKLNDVISDRELGIVYMILDYKTIIENDFDINYENYAMFLLDENDNTIIQKNYFSNQLNLINEVKVTSDRIINYNNQQYILVKSKIKEQNWTICCYVPTSIITKDTKNILKTTLMIIILCYIGLLTIIWLFSHTMVKGIEDLNKKIHQVEEGNLNITIKSYSKDEVGQLTNSFGVMVKKINTLIKEVYQKEIIQRKAELKALQAQVNPHFLYNTLSVMNWKALDVEAYDLSKMIVSLSKFYRTSLNKGKIITSFKNEISNTLAYIEIQKIVHNNSFEFEYKIDDLIYNYDTLNLLLQPIVENALEHGLFNNKNKDKRLLIIGNIQNRNIQFIVKDNGKGIDSNIIDELLKKDSKGYGLKNVNERIKLTFGQEYGIEIKSKKNIGTDVYVNLPKVKIKDINFMKTNN